MLKRRTISAELKCIAVEQAGQPRGRVSCTGPACWQDWASKNAIRAWLTRGPCGLERSSFEDCDDNSRNLRRLIANMIMRYSVEGMSRTLAEMQAAGLDYDL